MGSHEEPHPICSSSTLGFSSPAEAALCGGREGESGEEQPATQINLFPISGRAMRVWYFTKQFLPVIGSRCGMFPGQQPAAWRAQLHGNRCRIPLGRIPCTRGRHGTVPDPRAIPSEPRAARESITENHRTIWVGKDISDNPGRAWGILLQLLCCRPAQQCPPAFGGGCAGPLKALPMPFQVPPHAVVWPGLLPGRLQLFQPTAAPGPARPGRRLWPPERRRWLRAEPGGTGCGGNGSSCDEREISASKTRL